MEAGLNSRERVLRLFRRERIDRLPCFSGMGNITVHGLEKHGWRFAEIHQDARKMASMAASTFQLFGFECAAVPFDMGVEAEALGARVNYYPHHEDILYPTIAQRLAERVKDLDIQTPSELASAGRIPVVMEAIRLLKAEVGHQVAIGSWVLGPYTLAGQLVDIGDLAKMAFKETAMLSQVLGKLDEVLISLAGLYRKAGTDYITVREMGACADILSPRLFAALVRPHLERILAAIESPKVLHICGNTDPIVEQMAGCGADAISVEQKNHVAQTRQKLGPGVLIFGNLDPYNVLARGKPEDVDRAVRQAIIEGVNAVWPGCDIWPTVPKENMEALLAATQKYGKPGQA